MKNHITHGATLEETAEFLYRSGTWKEVVAKAKELGLTWQEGGSMALCFRDYIQTRRVTSTPVGDFVRDAKEDAQLPDVETWDQLKMYLVTKGAIPAVVDAARIVWRGFLTAKKKGA